jgi:hypothetical protein
MSLLVSAEAKDIKSHELLALFPLPRTAGQKEQAAFTPTFAVDRGSTWNPGYSVEVAWSRWTGTALCQ